MGKKRKNKKPLPRWITPLKGGGTRLCTVCGHPKECHQEGHVEFEEPCFCTPAHVIEQRIKQLDSTGLLSCLLKGQMPVPQA